jgi:hypothetical protein
VVWLLLAAAHAAAPARAQEMICGTDDELLQDSLATAVDGPVVRALLVFVRFCDDNGTIADVRGWPATPTVTCGQSNLGHPLPEAADGLLVPSPPNGQPPTAQVVASADSTLTAYFWHQSRGGADSLLIYGDVYPRDVNGDPYVYVTELENSEYHFTAGQGRGYGYLTHEILDFLDSEGIDFAEYDSNHDDVLDQLFIVVRDDIAHGQGAFTWGGVASLRGGPGVTGGGPHTLQYGDIEVQLGASGTYQLADIGSNIIPQLYYVQLMAHEYGHDLWGDEHLAPIADNRVPANQVPNPTDEQKLYGYNLMGGNPYMTHGVGGLLTISAHERVDRGWLQPAELSTTQAGLELGDLYTTGDAYRVALSGSRSLYLTNHQRSGYFDRFRAVPCPGCGPNNYVEIGLAATGLLATLGEAAFRLDVLPADNSLAHGFEFDAYAGDTYAPAGRTQLTPWTRPNINGCNGYGGDDAYCSGVSFAMSWAAVDSIRYVPNDPDSAMAFDFYANYLDPGAGNQTVIRADSWMGAETSDSTFARPVVVTNGATLTIWQSADINFSQGITVHPGARLAVGLARRYGSVPRSTSRSTARSR